jgi:hypothetical protein
MIQIMMCMHVRQRLTKPDAVQHILVSVSSALSCCDMVCPCCALPHGAVLCCAMFCCPSTVLPAELCRAERPGVHRQPAQQWSNPVSQGLCGSKIILPAEHSRQPQHSTSICPALHSSS